METMTDSGSANAVASRLAELRERFAERASHTTWYLEEERRSKLRKPLWRRHWLNAERGIAHLSAQQSLNLLVYPLIPRRLGGCGDDG